MAERTADEKHATILRNEVRRLLGDSGAPEVSDELIDALAEAYPQQPRAICAALRRLWRASILPPP